MDITRSALLTDLYQLAMTQAYIEHGKTGTAVFEFFARKLPPSRGFLIAAGLEQALDFRQQSFELPLGHALHGRCSRHSGGDDLLS